MEANVIYGSNSPLHKAIYTNDIVRLKQLLKTANPNLYCKRTGETPMHLACRLGKFIIVKLLRRHPEINMHLLTLKGTHTFPFSLPGSDARTLAFHSGKRDILNFLDNFIDNKANVKVMVDQLAAEQENYIRQRDEFKLQIEGLRLENEFLREQIIELQSDNVEVMGVKLPRDKPSNAKLPGVLKKVRELKRDLTAHQQKIWSEKEDENKCTICTENVRDVVLVPCGHFFLL